MQPNENNAGLCRKGNNKVLGLQVYGKKHQPVDIFRLEGCPDACHDIADDLEYIVKLLSSGVC